MSLHYQYADMHCDTLLHGLGKGVNDIYDMPDAMLDIKRMAEANVLCQFFAVFFPPRPEMLTPQEREKRLKAGRPEMPPDEELFSKAVSLMKDSFAAHKDVIRQAYCFDDVMKNKEGRAEPNAARIQIQHSAAAAGQSREKSLKLFSGPDGRKKNQIFV